jgi:hypothetical protein
MWRSRLKEAPPSHVRKQLLVPLLAYKLQEKAYGGLKPEIRRRLEKLAAHYRRDPNSKRSSLPLGLQRIKPGTRLLRQWGGKTHQVMTVEDGFEYEGNHYRSLTVIARLITGTHWSGPRFFGTVQRPG